MFWCLSFGQVHSQQIAPGIPFIEEYSRRQQIIQTEGRELNFAESIRPSISHGKLFAGPAIYDSKNVEFSILPVFTTQIFNERRPYGGSDFGIPPGKGLAHYLSGGFFARVGFLNLQFQPEFVYTQNKPFQGFSEDFSPAILRARFHYWNNDDFPETFSQGNYSRLWWGQSSLKARLGAFEMGISTASLWWGPGQWNSLTFSNNAESFPHLTLNTHKPAKTFLGHFEGQVMIGKLENSGRPASQNPRLNDQYFLPFNGDWRYLNALMLSYQPKWIPGFYLGFIRTFQQYNQNRGQEFRDYMPIFDAFQKKNFFENGHTLDFDNEGRDQQAVIFFRLISNKAHAEIYAEFGKRDHSFDWREALMNPEHARAFLFGFQKLFPLSKEDTFIQLRGEITHQQESVNRYIRYEGLGGRTSWATHYQVRGFVNRGQPLGTGIGTGSNSQTMELAFVAGGNKTGLLFERLANHQDFYYRAFGQQNEVQPWVDLSIGLLFDKRWDQFLLSSKVQLINGRNYQWQLDPNSTPEFPKGQHLFSVHSQVSLIYLFQKNQQLNP